ncbi:hypothetical protein ATI61_11865 [Archangium gephyra]|uniref:Glycerol-3-phosphate ABC transporter, ATP-binding protein UgpC n=1 Tax=Archangium gephyra TaxID=48 RepID=A0AAC8TG56_9BACT|nr:sel1 repeat family protein [Archangium gephyra]AKJ03271.1 Glycerol-3-phosphate ABC transporter, ATP-binding protein UgpC [Archangium gephyra]REG22860.1 hypothetical protein ATI61_11865 [Archangium gephyra]
MRRFWMWALLSVVACSEKKPQPGDAGQASGAAGQFKSEAALGNKDETCPGGTVRGCWDAASEAELKGDIARATELYTRVCEAGGARACNVLGILASKGGAAPERIYSLFMRGCDGGDMSGCYNAAMCHKTGGCAEKNDAEATKLLRRACDGGDADACGHLGTR